MTTEALALAAAQAVARRYGVACDGAVRIAAGSNVLVHLKPAPVAEHDRLWMTLWTFVAHDEHAAPSEPRDSAGRCGRPEIDRLRSQLDALTPAVFESSLPAQALHGDASLSNLLRTGDGLVWNDLEDVCVGPVAWDVAGLVTSARACGQSAGYIDELLARESCVSHDDRASVTMPACRVAGCRRGDYG